VEDLMTGLKQLVFALCLLSVAHTDAYAQPVNSETRGELLYATHCSACHSSEIHWRKLQSATDWNSLETQVRRWQYNIGLGWRNEEIADVVWYLNEAYYGFPLPGGLGYPQDKKPDLRR
jgi:mono/diheme cytochrome c family protein